jgi:hypothetical protein
MRQYERDRGLLVCTNIPLYFTSSLEIVVYVLPCLLRARQEIIFGSGGSQWSVVDYVLMPTIYCFRLCCRMTST